MSALQNSIFEKFKEISKRIFLMQKEAITSLKINSSEYKIITALAFHGELTQTILGEACGLDKPATSRILFKLHLQGFVTKTNKDGNKKNVYINLTDKGKIKAKVISDKLCEIKLNYFNKLNDSDTSLFLKLVENILSTTEVKNA